MTYSQFEVCIDTIQPSLAHIYFTIEKNGYQSSTNKQKIHAKTKQYADTRKTYTRM